MGKDFPGIRTQKQTSHVKTTTHISHCFSTSGRAPLEGDVITDARDEFDNFGHPCVSMSMNNEGARLWAQLTKQNVGKAIAIVLDGVV